ncbi:MAG: hypothetical protein WC654_07610 [Patescibacteria group bacterium]
MAAALSHLLRFACAACIALIVCAALPARAADLSMKAAIKEAGSWQSNPLMLSRGAESLYGSITTPSFKLESKTPTSTLNLETSLNQNFFNQSAYNSTDAHVRASVTRQVERWGAGLALGGDYDTTRTSEVTSFGINEKKVRHTGFSFSPDVSFMPTTRDKFTISNSTLLSRYDSNRYSDYNVYALTPSYLHAFTPVHSGVLQFTARRYDTVGGSAGETVDSIGPMAGWQAKFSPTLSAQALVGTSASKQTRDNTPTQPWLWDLIFSTNMTYKGAQDSLKVSGSRDQQPYSNGTSSILTTFAAGYEHAFNEHLSLNLDASYMFKSKSALSASNLDYATSARAQLSYLMIKELSVETSYRYRQEALTNASKTAQDNTILVGLTYRPELD